MRSIEMVLMTRSSKYGGYCVAGFDCATGAWVRLTSDDEASDGALSDEMLYDRRRRRCADVLDRIVAEISEDVPGPVQAENVRIDGPGRIRILGRVSLAEALRIHPCEERNALFASHHYMVQGDIRTLGHSLEMVRAENVRVYTVIGSSGKPKYKVDFECRGRRYSQFAMTDPAYYEKGEVRIGEAALVLSISDNEWSRANGNYIYAAKILPFRRKCSAIRRGRLWIAAGAVLAVIGLGIALASLGTVYVSPYSGTRYHKDGGCPELINSSAAKRIPTAVGMLLYRECSVCCE